MQAYLEESPYFCIMYAMTRAALLDIPALLCTKHFPPLEIASSINTQTLGKCLIIFSVFVSAIFNTKYLKNLNENIIASCKFFLLHKITTSQLEKNLLKPISKMRFNKIRFNILPHTNHMCDSTVKKYI